jgi:hypothetical protein
VQWEVLFYKEFDPEYEALPGDVRDELLAHLKVLRQYGPHLGRPRVDTLNGSKHTKMKELRFDAANGVWRFAFAFDTKRRAVILVGGDKSGTSKDRFYSRLIAKADERFDKHLAEIKEEERRKR